MKIIELSGDVGWEITARGLKNRLPRDNEDVLLKVDSFGGSAFEGVRLYNVIKDYPGKITAQLQAIAASAASFFPLSADKIEVRKNTTYMGHKTWTIAIGNSDDMMLEAEILDGLDNIIADAYVKKTGKDKSEILTDMSNEFWLSGGQAIVDAGFADAIAETDLEDESGNESIEKSEAVARIAQIKTRLQSSEQYNEEMKRAASVLTDKRSEIENIPALPKKQKAPQSEGINIMEETMTKEKLMADFPDLYQATLEEGRESVDVVTAEKTAVTKDRARAGKILKLAGISETIIASVNSDLTSGDYAEAAIIEQNKVRAAAAAKGGSGLKEVKGVSTIPGDDAAEVTQPKGVIGATKEQAAEINAWDAIYNKEAV